MRILHGMFILSGFLLVFLLSFFIAYHDNGFYRQQFYENGAYEGFGEERVDEVYGELLGYFDNENALTTDFFNAREKMHLEDVKNIINAVLGLFYAVFGVWLIFLIFFIVNKKEKVLFKGFSYSGIAALGLILIIALISFLNFTWLFTLFHLFSFDNELWLLPANSNLIQMFPQSFFFSMFLRILLYSGAFASAMILFACLIKRCGLKLHR